MSQVEHVGVGGIETRCGSVRVAGVTRQNEVAGQPQQSSVAPHAGVVLLVVHDERRGGGDRIGAAGKVADVRNPPLLIHDEILHQVEVLGPGLKRQVRRGVAVGTAVVHVHVEVGAEPPGGGRSASRVKAIRSGVVESGRRVTVRLTTRYSGPRDTSTSSSPAGAVTTDEPRLWK